MVNKIKELAAEVASRMNGSPFENHERILALVEAAKAEERERIRSGGKYIDCANEEDTVDLSFWHVPATILIQKEVV